jgi:hypothetical protein
MAALLINPQFAPGKLSAHPPGAGPSDAELAAMLEAPGRRRTRLADLSPTLHCSIIGTCLSTGELRQIVAKTKGRDLGDLGDHDIHGEGVRLAGRSDNAGKLVQKALDKRHQAAINRFAKARTAEEVTALWDEAKRAGDIPGAYWASLSHPAATDALVKAVFADVHMLSHLVGAANRADIRRLTQLEEEKSALERKLAKSQAHIQTSDATIRQLDAALAAAAARENQRTDTAAPTEDDAEAAALRRLVGELEDRLRNEAARRLRAEEKLDQSRRREAEADQARAAAEERAAAVARELAALEAHLADDEAEADETATTPLPAGLATLLYVGGRPGQVHRLRQFADQAGIALLHHDGGVEDRPGLLAGLISRADAACFPVDCVSHDAVAAVKRLCRQADKPYLPLRSVGLGSLIAGLARLAHEPVQAA